jgi:hypothetical protein
MFSSQSIHQNKNGIMNCQKLAFQPAAFVYCAAAAYGYSIHWMGHIFQKSSAQDNMVTAFALTMELFSAAGAAVLARKLVLCAKKVTSQETRLLNERRNDRWISYCYKKAVRISVSATRAFAAIAGMYTMAFLGARLKNIWDDRGISRENGLELIFIFHVFVGVSALNEEAKQWLKSLEEKWNQKPDVRSPPSKQEFDEAEAMIRADKVEEISCSMATIPERLHFKRAVITDLD